MFCCETSKISKNTFFTVEFQCLLLTFKWCFKKSELNISNPINTKLSRKKIFPVTKIQKQSPQVFYKRKPARVSTGVFLWILHSVQQISQRKVISEFYSPFKAFSILSFALKECFFFLWNTICLSLKSCLAALCL